MGERRGAVRSVLTGTVGPALLGALAVASSVALGAVGCAGDDSGFGCADDSGCMGMIYLPSSCHEAACVDGSCRVVRRANGESCVPDQACLVDGVCDAGECVGGSERCDDGVACTLDFCDADAGHCHFTLDDSLCDDDDQCTLDRCDLDGCVHTPRIGLSCDDGVNCTTGDRCTPDGCVGEPVVCESEHACNSSACNEAMGQCLLVPHEAGTPCDDLCHERATCDGDGHCLGDGVLRGCDEPPVCHRAYCVPGEGCRVEVVPDGQPCRGAGLCNQWGTCMDGACADIASTDCDDHNPCTVDDCDSEEGCRNVPVAEGTACDDGDLCTGDDVCGADAVCRGVGVVCAPQGPCVSAVCDPVDGQCRGVAVDVGVACDDGDTCTGPDVCDGLGRCAGTPLAEGTVCDDGVRCTVDDACVDGVCVGVARICEDGNDCTDDRCDEDTGACTSVDTPDGASCGGGQPCAPLPGTCAGGLCQTDVTPDGTPCEDTDPCTDDERCQAGVCAGLPYDCDDGDPCTVDRCDPGIGCAHDRSGALGGPCDDGNPCTEGDTCGPVGCEPGPIAEGCCGVDADCDDGWAGSAERCDLATARCVRSRGPCMGTESCRVGTVGPDGQCSTVSSLSPAVVWSSDGLLDESAGVRAWPRYAWQSNGGEAWTPSVSGGAALLLPPLHSPGGIATLSLRYRFVDLGDGGALYPLVVVVDGAVVGEVWLPPTEGLRRLSIPLDRTDEGVSLVSVEWAGPAGAVEVDELVYRLDTVVDCALTQRAPVDTAERLWRTHLVGSALGVRLGGESRSGETWTRPLDAVAHPHMWARAQLGSADGPDAGLLVAHPAAAAVAPDGAWVSCPAWGRETAACRVGAAGDALGRAVTMTLPDGEASLQVLPHGDGWLFLAAHPLGGTASDWLRYFVTDRDLDLQGDVETIGMVAGEPLYLTGARVADGRVASLFLRMGGQGCPILSGRLPRTTDTSRLPGGLEQTTVRDGRDDEPPRCVEPSVALAPLAEGGLLAAWVEREPVESGGDGSARLYWTVLQDGSGVGSDEEPLVALQPRFAPLPPVELDAPLVANPAWAVGAREVLLVWTTRRVDTEGTLRWAFALQKVDPAAPVTAVAPGAIWWGPPLDASDPPPAAGVAYLESGHFAVAYPDAVDGGVVRLVGEGCGSYDAVRSSFEQRTGGWRRSVCTGGAWRLEPNLCVPDGETGNCDWAR